MLLWYVRNNGLRDPYALETHSLLHSDHHGSVVFETQINPVVTARFRALISGPYSVVNEEIEKTCKHEMDYHLVHNDNLRILSVSESNRRCIRRGNNLTLTANLADQPGRRTDA